jgi:hypothetical protein
MDKLRFSLALTSILGFLSLIALLFQFLALSDILQESDVTLEWV